MLVLVGITLILFIVASMGLCFWFLAEIVLITQGCFLLLLSSTYKASKPFLSLTPPGRGGEGRRGERRGGKINVEWCNYHRLPIPERKTRCFQSWLQSFRDSYSKTRNFTVVLDVSTVFIRPEAEGMVSWPHIPNAAQDKYLHRFESKCSFQ